MDNTNVEKNSWSMLELEYIDQLNHANMRLKCAQEWIRLYSQGKTISEKCQQKAIDKIIIYGASDMAVFLIDFCIREGVQVIGISDSKITKSGMDYKGIPFLSVADINAVKEDATVVITAMGFVEEIKGMLLKKEITKVVSLLELVQ